MSRLTLAAAVRHLTRSSALLINSVTVPTCQTLPDKLYRPIRRGFATETKFDIPVLNIGKIAVDRAEPDADTWKQIGSDLVTELTKIGFVYISDHGISKEQLHRAYSISADYFKLDTEEKQKIPRDGKHGYTGINQESLDENLQELRETFDVQGHDYEFPDKALPDFRTTVMGLHESCMVLGRRLLKALEYGLGTEPNFMLRAHKDMYKTENNAATMRFLHYPPIPAGSTNLTRCAAHTDFGTLTLLLQEEMGGLEVKDKSGIWKPAPPFPGRILVNVGDFVQFWTNDRIPATEHRVVVPEEEALQRRSRYSVVFFMAPDNDVVVEPLDKTQPPKYKPVVTGDYMAMRFAALYEPKKVSDN